MSVDASAPDLASAEVAEVSECVEVAAAVAPAIDSMELTFRQLHLNELLIESLDSAGYSVPTPIQRPRFRCCSKAVMCWARPNRHW